MKDKYPIGDFVKFIISIFIVFFIIAFLLKILVLLG